LYAVKNGQDKTLPWTDEQYAKAVKAVHEQITVEKNKLVSIFSELCREKKQEGLVPLFDLTLSKIQANYAVSLGF